MRTHHQFVGYPIDCDPNGALGETRLGGVPRGFSAQDWPQCAACSQPMQFVLQLNLRSPIRQSQRFGWAFLFVCDGFTDDRGCETEYVEDGTNAIVLTREVLKSIDSRDYPSVPTFP